jgi:hypothetical protein
MNYIEAEISDIPYHL